MIFSLSPISSSTIVLIMVILFAIIASIAYPFFAYKSSNLSILIKNESLVVDIPIYGRTIPLENLDVSSAQIVNLSNSDNFRPQFRTNGIGLPNYSAGWFKLRNGEKAFLAVTNKNKVLYIQTTKEYVLLLSLEDPEQFLDHLIKASGHDA